MLYEEFSELRRVNPILTGYLKSKLPEFVSVAHKHFGTPFLTDFKWGEEYDKIKFLVTEESNRGAIDLKGNLILGASKFLRGSYDISNFKNNKLTGFGIITLFHEISHCFLQYKPYPKKESILSLPRLERSLIESFCDINAHRMAKNFNEAKKAIALEKKFIAGLVNRAKYENYYFEDFNGILVTEDYKLISSRKNLKLEEAIDELEIYSYTARAIAYSKLENYSIQEMINLFTKFRTFDELRSFIPKLNHLV